MSTLPQKKLLQFIKYYYRERQMAPTRREMLAELGVKSLSTVEYHLAQLEKEGFIKLRPYVDRGIILTDKNSESEKVRLIPLLGTVSAGSPLEVFPNQELISVPVDMINQRFNNYALVVRGDSMIDEHICHDDRIIVQSQVVAKNGDTVVALIDGNAATVKTIYFENGAVRLQPANRDYSPIFVRPPQTLEIQGIVVGVLRYRNQK